MMNHLLLLDAAPEPVSVGIGIAGFILVTVVVLMLTAAALIGFVFLLKRLRRNGAGTRVVVGDVCLNLDHAASQSAAQPQNSPNQP